MRSCLILGSGRSGTSMLAGTLAGAGYFVGERLASPRHSNPKGFFEDAEINAINEELLAAVLPARPPVFGRWLFRDRPREGQRWLARLPLGVEVSAGPELAARVRAAVAREPFCYKDPRFSYTLPAWRPFLHDTVLICVFRDPGSTVASILKECRDMPYLHDLTLDAQGATEVWLSMYRHVIAAHGQGGEWLFMHYDQLFDPPALARLAEVVDADIDRSFPDRSLSRSTGRPSPELAAEAAALYDRLCTLAGYRPAAAA